MTVISIPAMVFYWSGNPATEYSINSVVPALSLGNIGQSETACSSGTVNSESGKVEITVSCPFGQLDAITNFGQVGYSQLVQCNKAKETVKEEGIDLSEYDFGFYPAECSYSQFTDEDQDRLDWAFAKRCENKRRCNFKFKPSELLPD